MIRLRAILLCALLATLSSVARAHAEDGDVQPSVADLDTAIRALGSADVNGEPEKRAALEERMARFDWEHVAPHLDPSRLSDSEGQIGALLYADVFGRGESLFEVGLRWLHAATDERIQDDALTLLRSAFAGDPGPSDSRFVSSPRPPRLRMRTEHWVPLIRFLRSLAGDEKRGRDFQWGPPTLAEVTASTLLALVPENQPSLLGAMDHGSWEVRAQAILLLAGLRERQSDAARDALRRACRDTHPGVRERAVRGVHWGRWAALAPDLARRALDRNEAHEVRMEALHGLTSWQSDPGPARTVVDAALLQLIRDPDPRVRRKAVDVWSPSPRVRTAVAHALLDGDPEVRDEAANLVFFWIDKQGMRAFPGEMPSPTELELVVQNRAPLVAVTAAQLLRDGSESLARVAPVLARHLDSETMRVVGGAARRLGTLRGRAVEYLPALRRTKARLLVTKHPPMTYRAVDRAIEAVEMAALSTNALEAQYETGAPGDDTRARVVREWGRRGLGDRLRRQLADADAGDELTLAAALLVLDTDAHAALVVQRAHAWRLAPSKLAAFAGTLRGFGVADAPVTEFLIAHYRRKPALALVRAAAETEDGRRRMADVVWKRLLAGPPDFRVLESAKYLADLLLARALRLLPTEDYELEMNLIPLIEATSREALEKHEVLFRETLAKLDRVSTAWLRLTDHASRENLARACDEVDTVEIPWDAWR